MPFAPVSSIQELLELISKDDLKDYDFNFLDGRDMFTNLKITGIDVSYSSESATIYLEEE